MYAAQKGWTLCARHLLEKGADFTLRSRSGVDAITYAAYHGHAGVVGVLLDEREKREGVAEALVDVAERGSRAKWSAGERREPRRSELSLARFALPALMVASCRQEKEVVRVLLRAGVTITMVRALEEGGDNLEARNKEDATKPRGEKIDGIFDQLDAMPAFKAKAEAITRFCDRAELKNFRLHCF
jgi:ankyrin repeat protein